MKSFFRLILFLAFVGPIICRASEINVPLSQIGSHNEKLELRKQSAKRAFEDIVEMYDQFIREHPSDLVARIEECKFLHGAMNDDVITSDLADSLLHDRHREIAELFPDHYQAS